MPDTRFLLYIDFLGFREMVAREPEKVTRIYWILDTLNAHKHDLFKTIVFSDTVLAYNIEPANDDELRKYLVWYLSEFAEDLHHRLTGQDIYFRAVITSGEFNHYRLENVECFYGEALISAYLVERDIPSIGHFMDKRCLQYNRYYRTASFNQNVDFLYLNRNLESLNELTMDRYPITEGGIEDCAPHLPWEVKFLSDVHQ